MLLPPVTGQALLFSPDIEGRMQKEESQGLYTAERFRERRPDAYQAVVQLLGADVGLQRIGKLLGIHHLTAAAVRDLEPEAIDTVRSKMVTKLRTAVLLQVERLIEHPESVPMNVTGLIIAQLIDKAELLDGRATHRTERVERVDIYATWKETVEKLLDPASVVEIEAAPGGMGLGGGNVSAIGAPGEVGAQAAGVAQGAGSDVESLDPARSPQSSDRADTATDADRSDENGANEPARDTRNQGGRGSHPQRGGAMAPIDNRSTEFLGNGNSPL
jgi:hypothetical protein